MAQLLVGAGLMLLGILFGYGMGRNSNEPSSNE